MFDYNFTNYPHRTDSESREQQDDPPGGDTNHYTYSKVVCIMIVVRSSYFPGILPQCALRSVSIISIFEFSIRESQIRKT